MDEQQCLDGLEDERTIFRHPKDREHPYVMLAKATALNKRFSGVQWMAARHMLTIMLCMPDDWDFNLRSLADKCGIDKDTAASLVRLLIEAGNVVRHQARKKGRFAPIRYLVFEHPATVSEDRGHGAHRVRNYRTRSHRDAVAPCPVEGDILSTLSDSPDSPTLETEDRGREETPPAATPTESDAEADERFIASLADAHQKARGRPLSLEWADRGRLLELVCEYGEKRVAEAFRRFLAKAKDKAVHWFVVDCATDWLPPERRAPPTPTCKNCGKVLASATCANCGWAPGEGPGPPATPEEFAQAFAGLGRGHGLSAQDQQGAGEVPLCSS